MNKIIFLSFLLRLLIIFFSKKLLNYDLLSYLKIGQTTINIYPELAKLHHPYLPFFLYIERFFIWLGNSFNLESFYILILIKIFINLFDLANVYLVYLLSKKNLNITKLYAFNPISLLVFAFHGQFDSLPIFFVLLTIYLLDKKNQFFGLLSYSLAVMTKTWPLILIFFVLNKLKDKKMIFLIILFPLFSIFLYYLIYHVNFYETLKPILFYQGVWGIWGLSLFNNYLRFRYQKIIVFIFIFFLFIFSYLLNKKNYFFSLTKFLVFFYIFTPGFSVQYFSWLMPFLYLAKIKKKNLFIFLILVWMIGYYYQIIFQPSLNLFWYSLACWLIFSLFSLKYILLKKD